MPNRHMSDDNTERFLGNLDAKMDSVLDAMRLIRKDFHDHEARLRLIESKQSYVAGMAAAVGTGAALLASWIKDHVK